jgi:glycosyltransferase involved in cell wall biosynthesis
MLTKTTRVAIVHDWLLTYRGGENVLNAITELYPQADIYTLFYSKGKVHAEIEKHSIFTSFLNKIPFAKKFYRHFLPLMPIAIESFDLKNYDLVISSSHCVAKGVVTHPDSLHICYCHTPMRYIWDQRSQYFSGIFNTLISPIIHYLKMWDVTSSHRVDHFIANSNFVAQRIRKYYGRESSIIHPFVDGEYFIPAENPTKDYYLIVSALVPYKRVDLAIEACNRLDKRLLIVGDGNLRGNLEKIAGPKIEFLGRKTQSELKHLYQNAKALLFPSEEDFGIAPIESMACGRPVIAFKKGGAIDTILPSKTGLFFKEQEVESLVDAIEKFELFEHEFHPRASREQAENFSRLEFQTQFLTIVERFWNQKKSNITYMTSDEKIIPLLEPTSE